jgi:hypothetical protein
MENKSETSLYRYQCFVMLNPKRHIKFMELNVQIFTLCHESRSLPFISNTRFFAEATFKYTSMGARLPDSDQRLTPASR